MESDLGGLDLLGDEVEMRLADESLEQLPQEFISASSSNLSSRDTSMISASGASSQGNNGQQNPAVAGGSNIGVSSSGSNMVPRNRNSTQFNRR